MQCPGCRHMFEVQVWLVVDAGERPDLRAAICDGSIAQQSCPHCGAAGSVSAPLLYHDGTQRQLLLAVPLSVATPEAAHSLASELHQWLLESFDTVELPDYLTQIELVAELDGLQAALAAEDTPVVAAVQALLAADDALTFNRVLVQQRSLLMSAQADNILAQISDQARGHGDHVLARRVDDQRATLGRFRATLQSRQAGMSWLLTQLDHTPAQQVVLPTLEQMLHAADPQDVYAARIRHSVQEQAMLDQLLEQLRNIARAQSRDDLLHFLEELQRLQAQ